MPCPNCGGKTKVRWAYCRTCGRRLVGFGEMIRPVDRDARVGRSWRRRQQARGQSGFSLVRMLLFGLVATGLALIWRWYW